MADERPTLVYRVSAAVVRVAARFWLRLRAVDAHHVPAHGACLLASNHASYLDPPLIAVSVRTRGLRFFARRSLSRSPLGRWYFGSIRAIMVDREHGDVGAMRETLRALRAGQAVCLFPEGTRTLDGQLQAPRSGVGFLLAKASVPVIPIYVDGTFEAMPKGVKRIRRVPVTVRFGAAIRPEEMQAFGEGRASYERMAQYIMDRIAALRPQP